MQREQDNVVNFFQKDLSYFIKLVGRCFITSLSFVLCLEKSQEQMAQAEVVYEKFEKKNSDWVLLAIGLIILVGPAAASMIKYDLMN